MYEISINKTTYTVDEDNYRKWAETGFELGTVIKFKENGKSYIKVIVEKGGIKVMDIAGEFVGTSIKKIERMFYV
jgi:hypothetical protein